MEPVAGVIKVGTEGLVRACTMGKQVLYPEGNCVDHGAEGCGSGAAMPNFFTFGTVFLGIKAGEGHEVRLLEKGGVQEWDALPGQVGRN